MPPKQLAMVFLSGITGIYTRYDSGEDMIGACDTLIDLLVKGMQS